MDSHTQHDPTRKLRAARGTKLEARSWLTEAPLRMLCNNLDPEVAERPEELVDLRIEVVAQHPQRRLRQPAADAVQQPRSGGRRAPRGAGGLRRHWARR